MASQAACLLRGMGRPADQRNPLGRGAGRDRRRRNSFSRTRQAKLAKDRIISSDRVIAAAPDVIIGSWCGKPLRPAKIAARPGWDRIPAVRNGHIYEVKSAFILQPGPAALTEGVQQLHRILATVATLGRGLSDPASA